MDNIANLGDYGDVGRQASTAIGGDKIALEFGITGGENVVTTYTECFE